MKVEKARAFADPEAIRRATRHAQAIIEDPDFKIGPSYFMRPAVFEPDGLERVWKYNILPLLEEFHYGDRSIDVAGRYGLSAIRKRVAAMSAPITEDDTDDATDADADRG